MSRLQHIAGLLVATALLVPSAGWAQQPSIEAGLLTGPTWNSMTGGPAAASTGRNAHAGVFAAFSLGSGVAFRPELSATRKQVRLASFNSACPAEMLCIAMMVPTSEQVTFTWLEVPLLAEWRPEGRGLLGVTPRLFAGPFLAVRLGGVACTRIGPPSLPEASAEPVVGSYTSSCAGDFTKDGPEPASSGDAGFVVGGVLRRGAIGVGARWTRSLTDAVQPSVPDLSQLHGGRQSTLSLFVEIAALSRR